MKKLKYFAEFFLNGKPFLFTTFGFSNNERFVPNGTPESKHRIGENYDLDHNVNIQALEKNLLFIGSRMAVYVTGLLLNEGKAVSFPKVWLSGFSGGNNGAIEITYVVGTDTIRDVFTFDLSYEEY